MKKGFTLIEIAIVLVIIGIITGAVLKGQALIDNAKAKRFQSDVRGYEALGWTYYDRKANFPGDCNKDGVIDYVLATTKGTFLDEATVANDCETLNETTPTAGGVDTFFSDLRKTQIVSPSQTNVSLATHQYSDTLNFGHVTIGASPVKYNAVIAYGVPAWVAKMKDTSIDGSEVSNEGRVRRVATITDGVVTFETDWVKSGETDNTNINVIYFFDKQP
ncbi:type II secretion system protein [Arcobacter sp. FWKO B]|uniref:type II secretion system protein n=1 Tax=Arcobacter sp. FWKO B TaxID=2593672 RepID=UPI001905B09D|nr:type II secretion system protein [Arcobacter sp. FWKO B]